MSDVFCRVTFVQTMAMNIDGFACRGSKDAAVMVEEAQRCEVFRKANNSAGGGVHASWQYSPIETVV